VEAEAINTQIQAKWRLPAFDLITPSVHFSPIRNLGPVAVAFIAGSKIPTTQVADQIQKKTPPSSDGIFHFFLPLCRICSYRHTYCGLPSFLLFVTMLLAFSLANVIRG
jgi:hypothetical protein